MAKKINKTIKVALRKNVNKGGAWLCEVIVNNEAGDTEVANITAWANASAAKRHIKATVIELTPRKSIKLTPGNFDDKEKPTFFSGAMTYKVDA
jgi:hypothetical protein